MLYCALQADVLVATTIIENGIDMSNVNTIIVLSAERYFADLHDDCTLP